MECIRCKKIYDKEMFSVTVHICNHCRETARTKGLERERERAKPPRATVEGRAKARESEKRHKPREEAEKAKKKEYALKVYICEICKCELRNHEYETQRHKDAMKVG